MQKQSDFLNPEKTQPIDYLLFGHLTADLTPDGIHMGGTVAFSGLTAHHLGFSVGIVTSFAEDIDTSAINHLWRKNKKSEQTTTFKNISDGVDRTQYLYHVASPLTKNDLPHFPTPPKIVHLGPVANEVDPEIISAYPNSLKCMTPQGWFRRRDHEDRVELTSWENAEKYLSLADAAVISVEDVQKDETTISKLAASIPVFAVTENYRGARVYWHNDARFINAPEVKYVDDTGAGDIFAAAFFCRYHSTKDPWEAGRFAVKLASWSVQRAYLESIPTLEEINRAKSEVMGY